MSSVSAQVPSSLEGCRSWDDSGGLGSLGGWWISFFLSFFCRGCSTQMSKHVSESGTGSVASSWSFTSLVRRLEHSLNLSTEVANIWARAFPVSVERMETVIAWARETCISKAMECLTWKKFLKNWRIEGLKKSDYTNYSSSTDADWTYSLQKVTFLFRSLFVWLNRGIRRKRKDRPK